MFLADVIFPALYSPSLTPYFLPWIIPLALVSEAAVFFIFYRELTAWRIISGVLGANAFSWLVGILFGSLVPLAYEIYPRTRSAGEPALRLFAPEIGLVVALGVSIVVEYIVWAAVARRQPPPLLLRAVTVANVASYLVVIAAFVLYRAAVSSA